MEATAKVSKQCSIGPNVVIGRNCVIERCVILSNCIIMQDATIKKDAHIVQSVIRRWYFVFERANVMNSILGECVCVRDNIFCNGGVIYYSKLVSKNILHTTKIS